MKLAVTTSLLLMALLRSAQAKRREPIPCVGAADNYCLAEVMSTGKLFVMDQEDSALWRVTSIDGEREYTLVITQEQSEALPDDFFAEGQVHWVERQDAGSGIDFGPKARPLRPHGKEWDPSMTFSVSGQILRFPILEEGETTSE